MVVVNLVVTAISIAVLVRTSPESPPAQFFALVPPMTRYISYVVFVFGLYWLGSYLLRVIGHACGGRADPIACRDVIAWWMLVTAIVSLVELVLLLVLPSAVVGLLNMIAMIGGIFILSTYTAEVHGFESVGKVAAAIVATFFAVLLIANILLLSLASA